MGNTLQPDPSNAASSKGSDFSGWPDWNQAHGTGQKADKGDERSFEEIYEAQKAGARELREAKKPVHDD